MLKWLKTKQSNVSKCEQILRRKKTKDALDSLVKSARKDESVILQTHRQNSSPLLKRRLIDIVCQDVIDCLIDKIESKESKFSVVPAHRDKSAAVTPAKQTPAHRDKSAVVVPAQTATVYSSPLLISQTTKRVDLTWYDRASLIFLYLSTLLPHLGSDKRKLEVIARTGGVREVTMMKWVQIKGKGAGKFVWKWLPLVKNMVWRDVKILLDSKGLAQLGLTESMHVDDEYNVKAKLVPYEPFVRGKPSVLSKFIKGANPSNRAARERRKRKCVNVNKKTRRFKRKDKKKPRKYKALAKAVSKYVLDRWYGGDPATRREVYDEIRSRDDTGPGTEFHTKHLVAGKEPHLAMFLSRCLKRINFSTRKNSISQVVPDDWREQAEEASQRIREALRDCDIVLNADQTFVKMYLEDEKVLAPIGAKRVGGKVNATDKKAGFTVMITVEMAANRVCDGFIVFTGTKMSQSKRPRSTLDFKLV